MSTPTKFPRSHRIVLFIANTLTFIGLPRVSFRISMAWTKWCLLRTLSKMPTEALLLAVSAIGQAKASERDKAELQKHTNGILDGVRRARQAVSDD